MLGSVHLSVGTGRFSFINSSVKVCEALGASASNLLGEYIAGSASYRLAFLALAVLGLIPLGISYFLEFSSVSTSNSNAKNLNRYRNIEGQGEKP